FFSLFSYSLSKPSLFKHTSFYYYWHFNVFVHILFSIYITISFVFGYTARSFKPGSMPSVLARKAYSAWSINLKTVKFWAIPFQEKLSNVFQQNFQRCDEKNPIIIFTYLNI